MRSGVAFFSAAWTIEMLQEAISPVPFISFPCSIHHSTNDMDPLVRIIPIFLVVE